MTTITAHSDQGKASTFVPRSQVVRSYPQHRSYAERSAASELIEPFVGHIKLNVRRLFVLVAVVVVALSFMLVAGAYAGGELRETSTHVVGAGETLWDIAAAHTDPGDDVRRTLYDIERMNDLDGSVLVIGQSLVVPADD